MNNQNKWKVQISDTFCTYEYTIMGLNDASINEVAQHMAHFLRGFIVGEGKYVGQAKMDVGLNKSGDLENVSNEKISEGDPYQFTVNGLRLDPYRIARIYKIDDPVIFQAIKKLLRCGRKHKDMATDVHEAITSLQRWEEMNEEDSSFLEKAEQD